MIDEESESDEEGDESPDKEMAGSPPSGSKGGRGQDFIIDEPNVTTSPTMNPFQVTKKKKNKLGSTKKSKKSKKKDPNASPDKEGD